MKHTYIALVLIGSLFACESNTGEVKKADTTAKQENTKKDTLDIVSDIQKVTADLPSPVDFITHINQAKLDYNGKFLNSPDNVSAYLGTSQKTALNLGVYMVDLGYNSLYLKSQEGLNYLKTVKKLSDQLNILDNETKSLVTKFEGNLENRDSLLSIAREGYFAIDGYLSKNERKDVSSQILIGSWVEGLYLGTNLLKNIPNFDKDEKYKLVLWRIGGQKTSLNNLIGVVTKLDQNKETQELMKKLKELQTVFEGVKIEAGAASDTDVLDIAEVQSSDEISDKMMMKTLKKVEISKETFEQIHAKISEIRSLIVAK
ncbi:MAG: hypothetical protein MUC49_00190 [Raineya sp.]|jgi:hypothetical protein|nr:hypothetical protein [Raineya sp.]